jgi:Transcriptional regulator
MKRSKRSSENREKILSVAQQLFSEKGYDNTTIQDIIDQLGGMTKGAIYHYFSSKEEIMQCIMEDYDIPNGKSELNTLEQQNSGLQKLKQKMLSSLKDTEKLVLLFSAKALMKSPRIIGEVYLTCLKRTDNVRELIDEGIADGSIVTDYPAELAEFIALTTDMGFILNFPRCTREELEGRLIFMRKIFEGINVSLIDDEILDSIFHLYDHIKLRK